MHEGSAAAAGADPCGIRRGAQLVGGALKHRQKEREQQCSLSFDLDVLRTAGLSEAGRLEMAGEAAVWVAAGCCFRLPWREEAHGTWVGWHRGPRIPRQLRRK